MAFPFKHGLPAGGLLEFDRSLPLVCLYDRSRQGDGSNRPLVLLARGAPNHVLVDGMSDFQAALPWLEQALSAAVAEYGGCAVVEFSEPSPERSLELAAPIDPVAVLFRHDDTEASERATNAFQNALGGLAAPGVRAQSGQLVKAVERAGVGRFVLEIAPKFYDPATGRVMSFQLRRFAEQLHPALAELAYRLVTPKQQKRLKTPRALGRRHLGAELELIERGLAAAARSFNLILTLSPTNGEAAFQRFLAAGGEQRPELDYRPITIDPDELKRAIYQLPIENVADPALARLLREQRENIDNQLGMVAHRNTARCLYSSLHVYGSVEDKLYRVARGILEAFSDDDPEERDTPIGAEAFQKRALEEFAHYRKIDARFDAHVRIRDDITSLTVTEDKLLVPRSTALSERRANALLAHEVGTHLLTFYNGMVQPLELMSTGLAGYEQLQEGLAVVAEHLAGGLTPGRMRLLSARVIAVRQLLSGGEFVEVFREMHRNLGLPARHAFFVTLRVFRGGGFTKDAIYLRGVLDVLEHLRKKRPFELLLLGKFAIAHAPLVQELCWRGVLKQAALLPRVLKTSAGKRRLAALCEPARTVFDLCQREAA